MLKLPGALERLKPWQRRAIGAGVILLVGIPLSSLYNHKTFFSYESGLDALAMLLPLYLSSLAAWIFGLWLIVHECEEEFALMGDAFAIGVLLLLNCIMMVNLFPVTLPSRPQPSLVVLGAFWIPVAGSAVHFLAGLLLFRVRWAQKIRIDMILKVAVVIVMMGYVWSATSFFIFEKRLNEDPEPPVLNVTRFLMAEAAGVTMLGIMYAWMAKLMRWSWKLPDE
jgi:hypothetical protein